MEIAIEWRDAQPVDLDALAWSGGAAHLGVVEQTLQRVWAGEAELVVGELPNGRLVALGGLDLTKDEDCPTLWMLAVHEAWQGLGVGTELVRQLEDRARALGFARCGLEVEHDNPRAAALYRRLGYRPLGSVLDSWPIDEGVWVTVCTRMERALARPGGDAEQSPPTAG